MSKISEHYSKMKIKTIGLDREQHHKQRRGKRVQSFLRPPENRRIRTKTPDTAPRDQKPNGRIRKRIAGKVKRNSLEWLHRGKFLSIWEFSAAKNDGPVDLIPTLEDGELKTVNEFDYYSSGRNALKLGRTLIS